MKGWHFHIDVAHVNGYIELVYKTSFEDGVICVVEVDNVEGHIFCSCILLVSKGYWQRDFSQSINSLAPKAYQWGFQRL